MKIGYPYTDKKTITSHFGMRVGSFHPGTDLSAGEGTPILAVFDGVVVNARFDAGYGNFVTIDHTNGYFTRYAHLSRLNVIPFQTIKKGEIIGLEGSTGYSTGSHLHFEILTQNTYYAQNQSAFLDPLPFLKGEKEFPKPAQYIKYRPYLLYAGTAVAGVVTIYSCYQFFKQ